MTPTAQPLPLEAAWAALSSLPHSPHPLPLYLATSLALPPLRSKRVTTNYLHYRGNYSIIAGAFMVLGMWVQYPHFVLRVLLDAFFLPSA